MTRFNKAAEFTRFNIIKRSSRSAKEIIIVGIGKVTQFSIISSHRDKQSNTQAHKRQAKREANGKERVNKTARVKWGKRKTRGKWQIM